MTKKKSKREYVVGYPRDHCPVYGREHFLPPTHKSYRCSAYGGRMTLHTAKQTVKNLSFGGGVIYKLVPVATAKKKS